MAKKVTTIPATIDRITALPITNSRRRRVAGYARVSTDNEEQATSYAAQVDYYTNYIKARGDWIFAGIYTDDGITATNTKNRDGFNQMVNDALSGKIDLIVTKSISRFARNTVDSLSTIRKLKEKGVEVFFEKEGVWTLDAKGELLITILSSLAQEESRSISENTTWGKRKSFADGNASLAYSNFLGYDKGFKINEEQAKTVRMIYKMYLEGGSCYAIARRLMELGIKPPAGGKKWYNDTVKRILQNEKYKGDALLQKSYTVDFLTKKKAKNNGEVPQYYVEGHHQGIVSPEIFDMVQMEIARRSKNTSFVSGNILSGKVICGECGGLYGSRLWHSNDKYRRIVWQCNSKYGKKTYCKTPHVKEEQIKELFVSVLNRLVSEKDEIIGNMEMLRMTAERIDEMQRKKDTLGEELEGLVKQTEALIAANARMTREQEEYDREYQSLVDLYEQKREQYEELTEAIGNARSSGQVIDYFIRRLREMEGVIQDFDADLWAGLVECVTIYSKDRIVFRFRGGLEVENM